MDQRKKDKIITGTNIRNKIKLYKKYLKKEKTHDIYIFNWISFCVNNASQKY